MRVVNQLSTELRAQLAASLPEGYNLENLRVFTGSAKIIGTETLDAAEQTVIAKVTETAGPPKITEGKPTILRVVAWMAHEGPNYNRQGFVKEELQALAPTLFRAPNFGVMDFNHSAVLPDFLANGHPKVLGVWYKSEFAFDAAAKEGAGAWGIVVTGMMFAWAFPEHANQMLGEQSRSGKLSFSMACVPGVIEERVDSMGPWDVLHNPVFFTVSALDIKPADGDALGEGSENPAVSEDMLREGVFGTAATAAWTDIPSWLKQQVAIAAKQGETMEILEQLKAEKAAALVKIEELSTQGATQVASITTLEAKVLALESKIAELETANAGFTTKIAELETARTAVAAELVTTAARVAELEGQLKTAADQLAAVEAEKAAKAKSERLAGRIAALPASFQAAHAKKEVETRSRVETKWAEMDDATWTQYVAEELLGYTTVVASYKARSEAEGTVIAADVEDGESFGARAARLIKR